MQHRSALLPASAVAIESIAAHRDPRGVVFEPLAAADIAEFRNVHVVVSEPGAVRGNHRHVKGVEVTSVIGPAQVRYREDGAIHDVHVPVGEVWRFCFPAGVAHAFRNTGSQPSILASFNTQEHDREAPDVVRDVLLEP